MCHNKNLLPGNRDPRHCTFRHGHNTFSKFLFEDSKYETPNFEIVDSVPIDTLRGPGDRHCNRGFGVFHTEGHVVDTEPNIRADLSVK